MNQLFIQKLHESTNDNNRNLLESVERLYLVCEQKAQLESKLGRAAGIGAIAAGSYLTGLGTGVANADNITGAIDSAKQTVIQAKEDANKDLTDSKTVSKVQNRSYEGEVLKNHGYKFVGVDQHPRLSTSSFNGMPVNDLDSKDYVQAGWYVSPDGTKYYSTITGEVYKMPDGQTFDDATTENRGEKLGDGVLATGDVKDDEVGQCSLSMYGKYGKDDNCGPEGYVLQDDKSLEWNGAAK